jgi:hypothetical protein
MAIYKPIRTLKDIEILIDAMGDIADDEFNLNGQICYAISTCWWCFLAYHPGYKQGSLPCDPRGSMLMQAPAKRFVENAKQNAEHYGKHGLLAFMAAYHGNVVTEEFNLPTSLQSWKEYNDLIDKWIEANETNYINL